MKLLNIKTIRLFGLAVGAASLLMTTTIFIRLGVVSDIYLLKADNPIVINQVEAIVSLIGLFIIGYMLVEEGSKKSGVRK